MMSQQTSLKPKTISHKARSTQSLQSPRFLRVHQATSRKHRKTPNYLKAAQVLFGLLLAVDSPNNNSNCPEPSIHSRVILYHKLPAETSDKPGRFVYATFVLYHNFPAKTWNKMHASRIQKSCTMQVSNLKAFNFLTEHSSAMERL